MSPSCSLYRGQPRGFHHDYQCLLGAHVGIFGCSGFAGVLYLPVAGGPAQLRPPHPVDHSLLELKMVQVVFRRGARSSQASPTGGAGQRWAWAGAAGARTVRPNSGRAGTHPEHPPLEFYPHGAGFMLLVQAK